MRALADVKHCFSGMGRRPGGAFDVTNWSVEEAEDG
jgi:hypothetical protein